MMLPPPVTKDATETMKATCCMLNITAQTANIAMGE